MGCDGRDEATSLETCSGRRDAMMRRKKSGGGVEGVAILERSSN